MSSTTALCLEGFVGTKKGRYPNLKKGGRNGVVLAGFSTIANFFCLPRALGERWAPGHKRNLRGSDPKGSENLSDPNVPILAKRNPSERMN